MCQCAETAKTRCTRALHHIMGRGIERTTTFRTDQDREDFLKRLYPGAEVARFLGVTTSSVNRLAVSEGVANLTKYLKLF
jgi:hypothetical protein